MREDIPTLIEEASAKATALGLTPPSRQRQTKTPAKLRHDGISGPRKDEAHADFNSVRISLIHGFDVMLNELNERFCSDGLKIAVQREEAICEAATKRSQRFDLEALHLPATFDVEKLDVQLRQLKDFLDAEKVSDRSVRKIAQTLGQKDLVMQSLFSEVIRLISLCLCQPCSNASSERAFSALRRLKTWQRTTIGQS